MTLELFLSSIMKVSEIEAKWSTTTKRMGFYVSTTDESSKWNLHRTLSGECYNSIYSSGTFWTFPEIKVCEAWREVYEDKKTKNEKPSNGRYPTVGTRVFPYR